MPDVDPQTTTYYQCVKSKVYGLVAVIVVSNSDQIKPAIWLGIFNPNNAGLKVDICLFACRGISP